MIPSVSVVQQVASTKRLMRTPTHNYYTHQRPWHIQPTWIAPVLPGETLKNLNLQARCVSDPINNPLIGWWKEDYIFYVKLRDLYLRDTITSMFLTPGADLSALEGSTSVPFMYINGSGLAPNWLFQCTTRIVDEYFRNEGEVAADYTANNCYVASIGMTTALQSAINVSALEGAANIDQNLVSTSAGQGDATTGVWTSEIEKAMEAYSYARFNATTQMTFEDYCRAYGVNMPKEEVLRPELIRYSRDWTYPTNTVDPSSGTPRSAVSWATQLRADKDRLFKEPGFLVGLSVIRPKVYLKNVRASFTQLLRTAATWLPPHLAMDPAASYEKVAAGDPPLNQNSGAYLVDMKDLFLHGEQFTNRDLSSSTATLKQNLVALPNAALSNKLYPASTDADALFVDTTADLGQIRQDGVVSLHILGRQQETSPVQLGTNKTV